MNTANPPEDRTVVMTCTPTEAKAYLNSTETIARLQKSLEKSEHMLSTTLEALKELRRGPYELRGGGVVLGALIDNIESAYSVR